MSPRVRPGDLPIESGERSFFTDLYAALKVACGKVIGVFADRHHQSEYIELLELADRRTPKKKVLHLIVDNASSHDTKCVSSWRHAPVFSLRMKETSQRQSS